MRCIQLGLRDALKGPVGTTDRAIHRDADARQIRSTMTEIPWPTPMHMVARP